MFYAFFGLAMGREAPPGSMPMARYLLATYGAFGVIGATLFGAGFAASVGEIDSGFASLPQKRIDALIVPPETLFQGHRVQLVALAVRYAMPVIYTVREYVEIGGLMSYGADVRDAYRQAGNYVARILKGDKPADLPVMQATKFELVINVKTAKALRLTVPNALLAIADEVIE